MRQVNGIDDRRGQGRVGRCRGERLRGGAGGSGGWRFDQPEGDGAGPTGGGGARGGSVMVVAEVVEGGAGEDPKPQSPHQEAQRTAHAVC